MSETQAVRGFWRSETQETSQVSLLALTAGDPAPDPDRAETMRFKYPIPSEESCNAH